MRRIAILLALYLLPCVPGTAAADSFTEYSDVCWNVEAGDLLGERIGILRLYDGPYVFVQSAGGEWDAPFVAKISTADIKQRKLVFGILDSGKAVSFHGAINEKMITGQFDGWRDFKGKPLTVHLSKASASKKRVPNC